MFLEQLTHVRFAKSHRNSVDASFESSSEVLCLEGVLCAEFAGSFRDCNCQCKLSKPGLKGHTLQLQIVN